MNKHPAKKYPMVGACGLDCGLCPRYHTKGESRCPGCCGPDFWQKHPPCGFITCCVKQRNLETCAQCADGASCGRVARILNSPVDSIISYKPLKANFALIQKHGIEEFARREMKKVEFLEYLVNNYDDGRAKSFYCTAVQLLPLNKLKETMAEAEIPEGSDIKEKARIMRASINELADRLKIDLKLRK